MHVKVWTQDAKVEKPVKTAGPKASVRLDCTRVLKELRDGKHQYIELEYIYLYIR